MTQKEAINYLRQIYPNGGHCWLDEQRMEAIDMAINALKEEPGVSWKDMSLQEKKDLIAKLSEDVQEKEPVSDDFEKALAKEWQEYNDRGAATVDALEDNTQELAFAKGFYRAWHYRKEEPISEKSENGDFTKELAECIHQAQCSVIDPLAHAEVWKEELVKLVKCEEPVSEDLEAEIVRYIGYSQEVNEDVSTTKIRKAAHHFAEWQKKQMIDKFNEWCQEEFYIHPHDCNVVQYVSDKQLESIDDFIEEFKEKMEDKQ